MKNNISFYSHYTNSHNHPKFKTLRVKYGWAGEGKFWALNNMIADSEGCILDINKGYNKHSLAYDLEFTVEEFDEFLKYLAEECRLIEINDGKITTGIVQENYEFVMEEREKARLRKLANKQKHDKSEVREESAEKRESTPELFNNSPEPNKRVKESKVKENKVNENKDTTTADSRAREENGFISPEFEQLYSRYFSKPPNLGDIITLQEFQGAFPFVRIEGAFRKAREKLGDKINLAYIRGILYETGAKKKEINHGTSENNKPKQQTAKGGFNVDRGY